MQTDEIYSHAIDWIWGVALAISGVLGGAFVRLWRHEERIKALEAANLERTEAIHALGRKVDDNHGDIGSRIDSMSNEIRADLRVIMSRCLTVNHQ